MIITLKVSRHLRTLTWEARHRDSLLIVLLWSLMLAGALARPLMPIDETRYVSVAWEMWHAHGWWVPLMNGEAYSDKPPLLFWLIHAGWALFGVNDWWPKMISPLASLVAMQHLYRIARRLGYAGSRARVAPLILISMLLWNLYSGALMFDVLLSACLLGAIAPLIGGRFTLSKAAHGGLWLGLALLAKGPAAFVTLAPILLGIPWWRASPLGAEGRRHLVLMLSLGLALLLAWALPAGWLGGESYARDLLWGQSMERLHDAMDHAHPAWWYLPWLPLLLFPWSLWPPSWPSLPRHRHQRLAWIWALGPLLLFSLISGKQIHYLMPMLPAIALLIMDRLGQWNDLRVTRFRLVAMAIILLGLSSLGLMLFGIGVADRTTLSPFGTLVLFACAAMLWRQPRQSVPRATRIVAVGTGVAVLVAAQLMLAPLWQRYDVSAPGNLLAKLELEGVPVAFDGEGYQATFQFAGRLTHPLITLDGARQSLCRFQRQTPEGWIVGRDRDLAPWIKAEGNVHVFDYRGGKLDVLPIEALSLKGQASSCD